MLTFRDGEVNEEFYCFIYLTIYVTKTTSTCVLCVPLALGDNWSDHVTCLRPFTDPCLDSCRGQGCCRCSLDVALSGWGKGCGFRGLAGTGLFLRGGWCWLRWRSGGRCLLGTTPDINTSLINSRVSYRQRTGIPPPHPQNIEVDICFDTH